MTKDEIKKILQQNSTMAFDDNGFDIIVLEGWLFDKVASEILNIDKPKCPLCGSSKLSASVLKNKDYYCDECSGHINVEKQPKDVKS